MRAFKYFEYCMKSNQTSNQIQNGTRNSETFVSVSFALPPVKRRAKFNDFSRTIIERCVNCWLCCQEERDGDGGANLERAAAADANVDEKSVDYLERFERTNCAGGSNFSPFSQCSDRPKIHVILCSFLKTEIHILLAVTILATHSRAQYVHTPRNSWDSKRSVESGQR